jgi:TatD DNase family protein
MIIDSHCHLADPRLRDETAALLERAVQAGVAAIVSVGAIGSIDTDRATVEIAERYPHVYAVVGVHPHDAAACDRARLAALRALARSSKVVAIGESGLDFHYMHSPQEAQEQSLRHHIELAGEQSRPLVIHCRAAEHRLCEIVREVGLPERGGVIHCFSGDTNAACEFIELGFYISFSGIVTFKNADGLRAAVGAVPDDRIMVETDAPYLAPIPYRGKRNEPAFILRTLEMIAALRRCEPSRMAALTSANTRRLFRLAS